MKKYLKSSFFALVTIGFFSSFICTAAHRVEYYQSVLFDWGFDVEAPLALHVGSPGNTESKDVVKNTYVLFLSSQLQGFSGNEIEDLLKAHEKSIIICDIELDYSENIKCSYDHIPDDQLVHKTGQFGRDIFLIPEQNFVATTKREELYVFFESLFDLETQKRVKADFEGIPVLGLVYRTPEFKLLIGILVVFTLFLILKRFRQDMILEHIKSMYSYLANNKNALFLFLGGMMFMYIPAAVIVSYSHLGEINFNFGFSYIANTVRPSTIFAAISNGMAGSVLLFLYNIVVVLIALLTFLPEIVIESKNSFSLIASNVKLPRKYGAFCLLLPFVLTFSAITYKQAEYYKAVTLVLVFNLYISYLCRLNRISAKNLLTKKQTLLFTLTFVAFFGLVAFAKLKLNMFGSKAHFNTLGDPIEKNIMIPMVEEFSPNEKFRECKIAIDTPVFVDSYLVAYPGKNKVINTRFKSTHLNSSAVILNNFPNEFLREFAKNIDLQKVLSTNNTLYAGTFILGENIDPNAGMTANITFDCSYAPAPRKVKAVLARHPFEDVEIEEVMLMQFPGCDEGEKYKSYSVPFTSIDLVDTKLVSFDLPRYLLRKVTFYQDGHQIRTIPTGYYYGDPIAFERSASGDSIVAAHFSEFPEITVAAREDTLDISAAINQLGEEGLISEEFVIWSSDNKAIYLTKLP
jgi:hypothetical protein